MNELMGDNSQPSAAQPTAAETDSQYPADLDASTDSSLPIGLAKGDWLAAATARMAAELGLDPASTWSDIFQYRTKHHLGGTALSH